MVSEINPSTSSMEHPTERIRHLIILHLKGEELTVQQQLELQAWVDLSDDNRAIFHQLNDPDKLHEDIKEYYEANANVWSKVDAGMKTVSLIDSTSRPATHHIRAYIAAASLMFIIITGYFWLHSQLRSPSKAPPESTPVASRDVAPGGNKATLKLANGSVIVLDSVRNGTIAQQGTTSIAKLDNGQLAYSSSGKSISFGYNTISTPFGGQYEVTLPDQSKVWLNSGSSLRFPTAFTGAERNVSITGEAYFEVAKNRLMPFRVKVNDMYVTVLGTHFNIMAYEDEAAVKTTLLEGAVRISRENQTALLSPGQQAQAGKELRVVSDANMEEVVSWKEGLFNFSSADIETVMRSLARWYNVGIRYEGSKTSNRLTGKVRRDSNLSDVLQILSVSGYHFRIEGRTIAVLP